MIRPLLSLERLCLDERTGKVRYRYGKEAKEVERLDYLEFIVRVTSHIPDNGQVTIRYYGLCANAHRGKVKKASRGPLALRIAEEELRPIPSKGWAELIRKVYEVDPLVCPTCGGTMKVVVFLTDYAVVDKIIDRLKLTFVADKPPPPQIAFQEFLMAAEPGGDCFSRFSFSPAEEVSMIFGAFERLRRFLTGPRQLPLALGITRASVCIFPLWLDGKMGTKMSR